ncbi:MAG: hypothetical protein KGL98_01390 [Gammaproteobacteria bacterium]|nr:hypothetical protein [Gammaproteobacteria bacterium]MDE1984716.1 hypothetical protein [Gammaproteobacteria bacterium]MDE2109232.1 hypothetical protein [Gammaproteobacteria bacterium]MDE2459877.1 hypothetical protein [Gammaproteobacteria bacterium]
MKALVLIAIMAMALVMSFARAADVPKQCTEVAKGYDDATMYSAIRQGQLAKEEQPLLVHIQNLSNLAKDPKVSVGKQLTPGQLDEFQRIRAQLVYLQTEMFVASSRERDLSIIFHLCLASAESENLMNTYIANHGQLDGQYTAWAEARYDKSKDKLYLHLLDQLQGMFPTEFTKQMQMMQKLAPATQGK